MPRFFVPSPEVVGGRLRLPKSEASHAVSVLRVREGERVTALDGAGGEWLCEVGERGRRDVELGVLESRRHERPAHRLTLVQAIVKGKAMELILQKATELGATRIVPLIVDRSVARPDPAELQAKLAKWRTIAVESIKQCGAFWLPTIDSPCGVSEFLSRSDDVDLSLIASLGEGIEDTRTVFQEFRKRRGVNPSSASIWIGPEGDFSPSELEAIQASGVAGVSLGPLTLRSETAAICGLAIVGAELRATD